MLNIKYGRGKGLYTGNNPNDLISTPTKIAQQIVSLYPIKENEIVLDAFAGNMVFYNNYPSNCKKDWCEIQKGRDFFDYNQKVDWIITNPPYSIFDEVLNHSFEIATNVIYLIPLSKLWTSMTRIRNVYKFGGIKSIHILSASRCGFPFGFPAATIHIKKGYKGQTLIKEVGK